MRRLPRQAERQLFWKVTRTDGSPSHGGVGKWSLPKQVGNGWRAGRWRRITGPLVVCNNGLHAFKDDQLDFWIGRAGTLTLWLVEARGDVVESADKIVAPEMRLLRPVATLTPEVAARYAKFKKDGRAYTDSNGISSPRGSVTELLSMLDPGPVPKIRLVFGVHRLPIPERACPAWPTARELDARIWRKTKRRLLKLPRLSDEPPPGFVVAT